jgi:hypothetical protein
MDIESILDYHSVTAECRAKEKVCQVVKMSGISAHAEIYSLSNKLAVFTQ